MMAVCGVLPRLSDLCQLNLSFYSLNQSNLMGLNILWEVYFLFVYSEQYCSLENHNSIVIAVKMKTPTIQIKINHTILLHQILRVFPSYFLPTMTATPLILIVVIMLTMLLLLAFPQQQNFAIRSLAQISSGAIRCSFNTRFRTRFRRVLVQIPREVPEGSGADTSWGSGGFRWRYLLRLRRVLCASGGFRCRYLVRFWRVPVKVPAEAPEGSVRFRRVPVQIPRKVPEGSGEGTCWGSGGFRALPEGSGADTLWGSGGFRGRYLVRFRKVPVQRRRRYLVRFRRVPAQIPCEVPEGSGADALWNSKGFRCFYGINNQFFLHKH